jgi:hypothetical protein
MPAVRFSRRTRLVLAATETVVDWAPEAVP